MNCRRSRIIQYAATLLAVSVALCFCQADQLLEPDAVDKNYQQQLPSTPATEADRTAGTFRVADGFKIELVAAEPLLADPVAIAFDEQGAMFVAGMIDYSERGEEKLGVVRRLVDTDHDGRYDQGTDYVKGLSWPTAVACYDGGIFIGAAPDILYCKDTDGDGVADEKRVVFTGFSRQNVQGLLNSFNWGLDNRLYGSASTNGGLIRHVSRSDVPPVILRRQDFVIDPESMTLSSISGGAQHGLTFDRNGDRYVCSNSDHIQHIEFEERYLSRNPWLRVPSVRRSIAEDGPSAEVYRASPVEPWRIVRTRLRVKKLVGGPIEGGGRAAGYFTSATGVTLYRGDAFPQAYRNSNYAFIGDVGGNLVHRKRIDDQGLFKTARRIDQESEFITSTDTWFRPVQFANTPDGTLFAIDFYREVIEHPLSLPPMIKKHLDLNHGNGRGRIYRVAPDDFQFEPRQLPGKISGPDLVKMLEHANGWHQETAARLIAHAKPAPEIIQQLRLLLTKSASPLARVRALYCLATLDRVDAGLLESALQDRNAIVRQHACRVAESYAQEFPQIVNVIADALEDAGPTERFQIALTLGEFPAERRQPALLAIANKDANNPKMRTAILSSVGDCQVEFLLALLGNKKPLPSEGSDILAFDLANQIGTSKDKAKIALAIRLLRQQDSKRIDEIIAELVVSIGMRSRTLEQFLDDANIPDSNELFQRIGSTTIASVGSSSVPVNQRIAAMERLRILDWPAVERPLKVALEDDQPIVLRQAAIRTIGRFSVASAGQYLIDQTATFSPAMRRTALDTITSRPAWIEILLARIEAGKMKSTDLSSTHRQQLSRHSNAQIRKRAQLLFGDDRKRADVLAAHQSVLKMDGDVEAGRANFRKNCATCHRLDQVGHHVGPDLQPLRNRGAAFMLTNIIDPNREVDARFEAYSVLTSDGRSHTGLVTAETTAAIELTLADGKKHSVLRSQIEDFKSTGMSLMPEGLEREFNQQAIADLIAYLIDGVNEQALLK